MLNPSGPGILLVERILIKSSISLCAMCLFVLLICSSTWLVMGLGKFNVGNNVCEDRIPVSQTGRLGEWHIEYFSRYWQLTQRWGSASGSEKSPVNRRVTS